VKPSFKNIFYSKYTLLLLVGALFLLSNFFNTYYSNSSSLVRNGQALQKYLHNLERSVNAFCADTAKIKKLINEKETLTEFEDIVKSGFGVYLYTNDLYNNKLLRFWNEQRVVPDSNSLQYADGEYFQKLPNGYYGTIKRKVFLSGIDSVTVVSLIPVKYDFYVENENLGNHFIYDKKADRKIIISKDSAAFPILTLSGKTLFYVDKKTGSDFPASNNLTFVLRIAAFIILFLFFYLIADGIARKKKLALGLIFLIITFTATRAVLYYFPDILNLRQFELFNPSIYSSGIILKSLGDILINALLLCWTAIFIWSRTGKRIVDININPKLKWLSGFISLMTLTLVTIVLADVIKNLVADSNISFDVTDFSSINRYSVIGFIVLACLSLAYFYFTRILFYFVFAVFKKRQWVIFLIISISGLLYLTLRGNNPVVQFYLFVLFWLLFYTWLFMQENFVINRLRVNMAGILFWIFLFSASIASVIILVNKNKEWKIRKNVAEKLSLQYDPASELLPSIAVAYFDNEFLSANFTRFFDKEVNAYLRDSIIRQNFKGYLKRFNTRIYVYDKFDKSVFNDDPSSYGMMNTATLVEAKPTSFENLYRYETSYDKLSYIFRREAFDPAGKKIGTLFIRSDPKKHSSDALYSELFRQIKDKNDPDASPLYSYAIYNNLRLTISSAKYPFATSILEKDVPVEEFKKIKNNVEDELWHRAGKDKVVVVVKKKDSLIEAITLFSWLFCSFLFLVVLLQLISLFIRVVSGREQFRKAMRLNIRSQVHGTIIFISLLSFIIIGAATISFFIQRYKTNNSDKLSRTMSIVVKEMKKNIGERQVFDDALTIYDSAANLKMQKLADEIADIHNVDVNVFDTLGNLQVSSDADVYTKGIFSRKMHPLAFYNLDRLHHIEHTQQEEIGNFSYPNIYAPVRNTEGVVYCYVNVPFFNTQNDLNREISNFLVTIINLNAFIFLIAGIIALFITNRITNSFSLIGEKMREVNLGKRNEEIDWKREDEIGELVVEYNKMVSKLGESAAALAKSEREGAWREMARQVAHEIKNPLTPMKLSIQYLQKAIDNNQSNVKELTANVAATLVEQIDHLAKIAADFSQFANIGNTNTTKFDLHEIINSLKALYLPYHNVEFKWNAVGRPVMINADKTQMNRLFTNLFQNAVEAAEDEQASTITVSEMLSETGVLISVSDNGMGILPEMQPKIFAPNFTTKSSGTGLGLAMCKSIVEQAHGKIWFETQIGKGTIFFVELPVINSQ
jgi:two-component system, NtrC family, nitrogen regulation sensor histidine kinase NtrY